MAASIDPTISQVDWLYPELLSKEGLIEILSQRFVKLPNDVDNMLKEDLLQLYYKFILPKPQRKYRLNRRGREMTKKQIIQARKRKNTQPDTAEPSSKKKTPADSSSHLLTSFDDISLTTRLKPPPSCINFEKKVIKLSSSNSAPTTNSLSSPPQNKTKDTPSSFQLQKITINQTSSSGTTNEEKSSTPKKKIVSLSKTVKEINSHLDAAGDAERNTKSQKVKRKATVSSAKPQEEPLICDAEEKSFPTQPKKAIKIKRISWP